jgi:hypothetical protein
MIQMMNTELMKGLKPVIWLTVACSCKAMRVSTTASVAMAQGLCGAISWGIWVSREG